MNDCRRWTAGSPRIARRCRSSTVTDVVAIIAPMAAKMMRAPVVRQITAFDVSTRVAHDIVPDSLRRSGAKNASSGVVDEPSDMITVAATTDGAGLVRRHQDETLPELEFWFVEEQQEPAELATVAWIGPNSACHLARRPDPSRELHLDLAHVLDSQHTRENHSQFGFREKGGAMRASSKEAGRRAGSA